MDRYTLFCLIVASFMFVFQLVNLQILNQFAYLNILLTLLFFNLPLEKNMKDV